MTLRYWQVALLSATTGWKCRQSTRYTKTPSTNQSEPLLDFFCAFAVRRARGSDGHKNVLSLIDYSHMLENRWEEKLDVLRVSGKTKNLWCFCHSFARNARQKECETPHIETWEEFFLLPCELKTWTVNWFQAVRTGERHQKRQKSVARTLPKQLEHRTFTAQNLPWNCCDMSKKWSHLLGLPVTEFFALQIARLMALTWVCRCCQSIFLLHSRASTRHSESTGNSSRIES